MWYEFSGNSEHFNLQLKRQWNKDKSKKWQLSE